MSYSKNRNINNINKARQQKQRRSSQLRKGTARDPIGAGKSLSPKPEIKICASEKKVEGYHNAAIIFGQDRPGSCFSGYGGRGDTHAGQINLVVGVGGIDVPAGTTVDPTFDTTAAGIRITAKSDIDADLQMPPGPEGHSRTRSAVAVHADAVRVVAREGVRIRAGHSDINSQESVVNKKAYGIHLIGGALSPTNQLQPIPRGTNLLNCLMGIVDEISRIQGILDSFLTSQLQYNIAIQNHTHISPFFAIPTAPSPELLIGGPITTIDQFANVKTSLLKEKVNLSLFKLKYLTAGSSEYINSFNNKTT